MPTSARSFPVTWFSPSKRRVVSFAALSLCAEKETPMIAHLLRSIPQPSSRVLFAAYTLLAAWAIPLFALGLSSGALGFYALSLLMLASLVIVGGLRRAQ